MNHSVSFLRAGLFGRELARSHAIRVPLGMGDINDSQTGEENMPPEILEPSEEGWLASLLPEVIGLSASASYDYDFVGSSFMTTPEGCLITADHVAKKLDDYWWNTRAATASNIARPGALYIQANQPFQNLSKFRERPHLISRSGSWGCRLDRTTTCVKCSLWDFRTSP
jgi:hypothetical protein